MANISVKLYLELRTNSSRNNPLKVNVLVDRLSKQGVKTQRRCVSETLNTLTMSDIGIFYSPKYGAYYDITEDASRFIHQKDTMANLLQQISLPNEVA